MYGGKNVLVGPVTNPVVGGGGGGIGLVIMTISQSLAPIGDKAETAEIGK
jgi:hypothetical protein